MTEPSAAPTGLSNTTFKSTYLVVSWKPLPVGVRNGIITRYTVCYRQVSGATGQCITSPTTSANITGLSPFKDYLLTVSASTYVGEGPKSAQVKIKTAEASKSRHLHIFESSHFLVCIHVSQTLQICHCQYLCAHLGVSLNSLVM